MQNIDVAVVTLFNPQDNVLENIQSYLPFVKELLIIDNSKVPYDWTALYDGGFSNITVLSQRKNIGISKALNLALRYAQQKNYQWLLTMDQDSYFEPSEMVKFVHLFQATSKTDLAIFSPLHNKKFLQEGTTNNCTRNCVMTSANIINVDISNRIGGFDENLFIDEVDHDFCLRLREHGYKIIQNYNCYVEHSLGELHHKFSIKTYSYKRLYYMVRNYLYMRKKHKKSNPSFFRQRDLYLFKFMIKQLIYTEEKNMTMRMIYVGIQDYRNNQMGYRVRM